jgi:hypothetical protein
MKTAKPSGALLAGLVFALAAGSAGGAPVDSVVGPESAALLREKGSVKAVSLRDGQPDLLPDFGARDELKALLESLDPSVMVESLYLFKKPPETGKGKLSGGEMLVLFNALRSISTLTGIEYFSASRGRMRTFYEYSFAVDGEKGRERRADPVAASLPVESVLFAIQKDLTFGENRYRYDYRTGDGYIRFVQENLTPMNYGIVPILGKGRLRTIVVLVDAEDALILYCVSAAKAVLLPGIEGKVRNSFSNRADALFAWFEVQAEKSLKAAK